MKSPGRFRTLKWEQVQVALFSSTIYGLDGLKMIGIISQA